MRFNCPATALLDGLNIVTHVLSTRTTQPILEGVLLRATDEGIQLTCSDGAMSAVTTVPATVEEDGDMVLPGRLFLDVARRMPQAEMTVSAREGGPAQITCMGARMTLATQPGNLFPALPLVSAENSVILPQKLLKEMLSQVAFAIAVEDPRKVLNGCLFEIENGEARMVALDGFRLALRRCRISGDAPNLRAILPARTVGEIVKILEDDENKMAILLFGGAQMTLNLGQTQFYSTLIEGEYIDYRRIIPAGWKTRARFDRTAFSDCVERSSLIARAGKNNLMKIQVETDHLVVTSNAENGDAYEEFDAEVEGEGLSIAFNVQYVSDILRAMPEVEAYFCFNSPVSPCIIRPVEGDDFTYLMLPVRVTA